MRRLSTSATLLVLPVLLISGQERLQGGFIDFESFPNSTTIPDGTAVTSQFSGWTFTNTTVLTAGIGLNELEFPPHSGTNVAFDDGGPITIVFDSPISSFSGFFTYLEPVTLTAFDVSDRQISSMTSAFSSNDALFGDPGSSPNEFLLLSSGGGISSVIITGDPAGGSFTVDDITSQAVPEPASLSLLSFLAVAIVGAISARRRT